jgi:hypothetical protein
LHRQLAGQLPLLQRNLKTLRHRQLLLPAALKQRLVDTKSTHLLAAGRLTSLRRHLGHLLTHWFAAVVEVARLRQVLCKLLVVEVVRAGLHIPLRLELLFRPTQSLWALVVLGKQPHLLVLQQTAAILLEWV